MAKIVGIDEVGRGPLAGPVTVCVVVCEEKYYKKLKKDKNLPPEGIDSKKLSQIARVNYSRTLKLLMSKTVFDIPKGRTFGYAVCHVSNKVIDEKGISLAICKAMNTGIKKLNLDPTDSTILLDGGLKVSKKFKQKTIIKGDEKEKIISWASILAKVARDELMKKFSKKYPEYGFGLHKGYGTKLHRELIRKHGPSKIHRKSFHLS